MGSLIFNHSKLCKHGFNIQNKNYLMLNTFTAYDRPGGQDSNYIERG